MFQAGDYDTTETVNIPFNTFSSDDPSASVTVTNLVAGDIEIHKDGSTTKRASDNGVTVSIDFDTVTGGHMVHIDLSDNSDVGYYAVGSRFQVRLEGITVDGATLNVWIGCFSIGCVLRPTTAGRTLDIQSTGEVDANLTMMGGVVQSATDLKDFADTGYNPTTHVAQSDLVYIHGTALTETGGQLAGAFVKFFDVASPTGTVNSLPDAIPDAAGGLPVSDAGGLDLDLYLKSGVTLSGTASVGDTTIKITLNGGVAEDNYYNGQLVVITGGTGAGQSRTILKYLSSGNAATPTRDFTVAPDNTSTFVVIGADVPSILEAGTAADGAASTITLDATASTTVDIYKNNFIMISGGTGAGQTRLIGAYSAQRVATVLPNWTTTPDSTSIYQVLPAARVDIQGWAGNVVTGDGDWAALKTDTGTTLPATLTTITTHLTDIKGNDFTSLTDSLRPIRLRGDVAWITADVSGLATAAALALVATDAARLTAERAAVLTEWIDGGRLDLIMDAILAMLDDARTEPGQGAPPVNPDAMTKLDYLYKAWRNKMEGDASTVELYNDAGSTVDQKWAVSDDNTDFSKGEVGSGP